MARTRWHSWRLWLMAASSTLVATASDDMQTPIPMLLVQTPPALNPQLTNIIENNTFTLYYNGSGPVPANNLTVPQPLPITPLNNPQLIEDALFQEFVAFNQTMEEDNCAHCIAMTELLHVVAYTQPVSTVVNLLTRLCKTNQMVRGSIRSTSCEGEFGSQAGLGPYYVQLFAKMSLKNGDMLSMCSNFYKVCPELPAIDINESLFFDPKPESAEIAPEPSGETLSVIHLSDWHLDPRYDIGSESNCTQYQCCRVYSTNEELKTHANAPSIPASRFGSFSCDAPPDLALSSLASMSKSVSTKDLAFTIFTGDIVSHDFDDYLSQEYVEYEEKVTYEVFRKVMKDVPVYATLGNHDTLPLAFNTPHSLNPDPHNKSSNAMSWNYDLVSALWEENRWLSSEEARFAAKHYGAYATTTSQGLRIISLNTDFWYRANIMNYINVTNPDPSGILKWLADELTASEKKRERVWIIGHVLSGYDGFQPLPNPTALFYSIVRRFSPATIAGVFFGHTHLDQLQVFYDFLPSSSHTNEWGHVVRRTSDIDLRKPLQVSYGGPSITPMPGYNSAYTVYQIDAKTFSVVEKVVYFANISNSLDWNEPIWEIEYDARQVYGRSDWPKDSPLNGTFWHDVTELMLKDSKMMEKYSMLEHKSTAHATICTDEVCHNRTVCFIRSGSGELGARCRATYGVSGLEEDSREGHYGHFH